MQYKNENNQATIHDSKYGTTRVLFASTYTAKQMKTMYYSLIDDNDLPPNTARILSPLSRSS